MRRVTVRRMTDEVSTFVACTELAGSSSLPLRPDENPSGTAAYGGCHLPFQGRPGRRLHIAFPVRRPQGSPLRRDRGFLRRGGGLSPPGGKRVCKRE